jgi:hypothetical protein
MYLYLISISSNDDDQCVYISYPYQTMMMINVYLSHIFIKQWWWSMYLYLISISNNDDDHCIYISCLYQAMMIIDVSYDSYPYQAMMMTIASLSHIHIMQWWWSMFLYLKFLSRNDDDQFVCIFYDIKQWSWLMCISHIHIKQWWWSICLYLIFISSNDDCLQCVYISYPNQAMMMTTVSLSHIHIYR